MTTYGPSSGPCCSRSRLKRGVYYLSPCDAERAKQYSANLTRVAASSIDARLSQDEAAVVILDNLSAHKSVAAAGYELCFLFAYSQHFTPLNWP